MTNVHVKGSERASRLTLILGLAASLLAGCASAGTPPVETAAGVGALPPSLQASVTVLDTTDPDYSATALQNAVKPAGEGGVSEGVVVRVERDMPVYRLWSGPEVVNAQGYTNRVGGWWSSDAPTGTRDAYRQAYAICVAWNELTWVATCTLAAGTVVVVGPGQSVSAATCGGPGDSYPANTDDWQMFIPDAWQNPGLRCPDASEDYQADPSDLSRPVAPPAS